jgi:adenylate cyclase
VALHYGSVSWGNIGYGHRLDFTLIGPDVNLVSRLQGVCSTTGQTLLMSRRFAELLPTGTARPVGAHLLKGFAQPVDLYALSADVAVHPHLSERLAERAPPALRGLSRARKA